ncbi:hypothetical protein Rleg9DRAFT_1686 [Rhizobium leguminosarum bv. trifolii WSM597]|uniref:Uncharacterized protein n=1 Tax=Rhizobium leguminosarum bv. trifolii WSM597 TaxID=754764 RepID=I9N856_RHILT|nr:hypothetical protein [Rhizobium leguminosarum]EJB02872.1 hypothetical protein Rleg9DRAFT_1686 [Rhizobium leguminosarum bv. trifolii WSM597]
MAQVPQLTVLDANGDPLDVATVTALIALVGEVQASPTANTLLDRVKAITTALGTTLAVNQVSTAADVSQSFTRQNNTTAYAAGAVVGAAAAALQFTGLGKSGGASIMIVSAQLEADVATAPGTAFRLHLYSATPPSAPADAAAFDVPSGDRSVYLGFIDIPAPTDIGSIALTEVTNVGKQIRVTGGDVFGVLQAVSAYTPTALAVYKVSLHRVEV